MQEQIALAAWLVRRGVRFAHPPNEGRRSRRQGALLKSMGMSPGLPDVLIFDAPPGYPDAAGVAIELKRVNGRPSQVSPAQREWLEALELRGWKTHVAYGCDDAVAWLEMLGF